MLREVMVKIWLEKIDTQKGVTVETLLDGRIIELLGIDQPLNQLC